MSPVLDMGGLPERGAEERVDVRTGAVRLLGGELIAAARRPSNSSIGQRDDEAVTAAV